jgi:hypothetical protein
MAEKGHGRLNACPTESRKSLICFVVQAVLPAFGLLKAFFSSLLNATFEFGGSDRTNDYSEYRFRIDGHQS